MKVEGYYLASEIAMSDKDDLKTALAYYDIANETNSVPYIF